MTKYIENGIIPYKWDVFASWENRLKAVITTRIGGISLPPISSLSLGHLADDNPSALAANRACISRAPGIPGAPWANIGNAGFCTACRTEKFFSYKKERGLTGRHAALMVLL